MTGKIKLSTMIASNLHDNYAREYKTRNGENSKKWKVIKDSHFVKRLDKNNLPPFIRKNILSYEIDICNAKYEDLSPDLQLENKLAGEVIASILKSKKSYSRDEIGDLIHSAWLERNGKRCKKELKIPFKELPLEEKEKDWNQFLVGLKIYRDFQQ